MNRSSTSTPSGSRSRAGVARGLSGIREVIDELRSPAGRGVPIRSERSDVRDAVLLALAEQPGNGYQIVRRLEEDGGDRTPGAGAVYPTLQLLADEGLATAAEADGRKTWTLTTAGLAAADAARDRHAGTEPLASRGPVRRGGIARSASQLVQAAALAGQSGSPEQTAEVVAVLDDARRRILSILARG